MPRANKKLTDEQLKIVEALSAYRVPMEAIASKLGISKKTLERCVKRDKRTNDALLKGRAESTASLFKTAYSMANSGKMPVMTIFYLKTQHGWKDVQSVENLGPDGKPYKLNDEKSFEEKMEELAKLNMLLKIDEPKRDT